MCASKQDPLTDEVTVLHVNPQYVHVRKGDGTETTVSIRDLAPAGNREESTVDSSSPPPHPPPVQITPPLTLPPPVQSTIPVPQPPVHD